MPDAAQAVSLEEIERLCRSYAKARDALADLTEQIREERRKVIRPRMRSLRSKAAEALESRDRLQEAILSAPHLFTAPRTRTMHGVKVGYLKQRGRADYANEADVISRIRERLPEREPLLIRVKETLNLNGLRDLDARQMAAIGVTITDVDDKWVISTAKDDLDRIVDALIDDGEDAPGEAAA